MPTFTPPLETGPASIGGYSHPLWRVYGNYNVGVTVWRDPEGNYHQSQFPYHGGGRYVSYYDGEVISETFDDPNESLANATEVYIGGASYPITQQQADDLTAAGYGANITP